MLYPEISIPLEQEPDRLLEERETAVAMAGSVNMMMGGQ
jgi:hypothetical protein